MKVMKVELLVFDNQGAEEEGVKDALENNRHLDCRVKNIQSIEIEWTDDHPLNMHATSKQAYLDLFSREEGE